MNHTTINLSPRFLFRRRDPVEPGLAYFPGLDGIDQALASLAHLAVEEEWGPNRTILFNYVDYTVNRLLVESKIAEAVDDRGEPVAAFNTGLLTPETQPIYAFLSRNRNDQAGAQPWFFGRWALSSDIVMRHFQQLPERARYYRESPAEFYFHSDYRFERRLEHISDDNVERFPRILQQLAHLRKHALNGGIDDALAQAAADPHLVVPAYHVARESVSLLLPLRLVHAAVVDLALVIGAVGESQYTAWTVFPMDWAYKAARLIKPPGVKWIASTAVGQDSRLNEA